MEKVTDSIVLFREQGLMAVKLNDPTQKMQAKLIHGATYLDEGDTTIVMVPWNEGSCMELIRLGVDATPAAPLLFRTDLPLVEGKYKPMTHQLFTAAFMTLNPRCHILNDPRTGKTGALIIGADYLRRQRYVCGGWLIITTVTTMPSVWGDAIQQTIPDCTVRLVHGKNREGVLEKPADFYVTNYDSCRLSENAFVKAVRDGRIGGVIIDEMTHVGNSTSKRHKAIDAICNKTGLRYVIGATGSPGENPETVFGMCKMINRDRLPCHTKTGWMNMVTYQYGPEPFMRKPTAHAPEVIFNSMQPAVRFNKADIIDLPPVTTQDRYCALSQEQERVRKEFKTAAIALMESGETITAVNGGVLFGKLMQAAQGFVMTNDGKPVELEHDERTRAIVDAIGETSRKVVVFCCYRATIEMRRRELEAAGYTVGVVDGSIKGEERARILSDFQNKKDPHVLVCHPTTVAFGTEMSAADTMVFDGPPALGGFIYAQALERLSSSKQTASNINIIRIAATAEERKAYAGLDSGKVTGQFVSSLFEDFAKGVL